VLVFGSRETRAATLVPSGEEGRWAFFALVPHGTVAQISDSMGLNPIIAATDASGSELPGSGFVGRISASPLGASALSPWAYTGDGNRTSEVWTVKHDGEFRSTAVGDSITITRTRFCIEGRAGNPRDRLDCRSIPAQAAGSVSVQGQYTWAPGVFLVSGVYRGTDADTIVVGDGVDAAPMRVATIVRHLETDSGVGYFALIPATDAMVWNAAANGLTVRVYGGDGKLRAQTQ
jgi:hypothetical protein